MNNHTDNTLNTRRRRFAVSDAFGCLVVAGCTGSEAAGLQPLPPIETSSTTVAPTATTEAPTTTTTTTTEALSDEEAVRAAHAGFMTEFFDVDELVDGYEPRRLSTSEYTTGAQTDRSLEVSRNREAAGESNVGPGYVSNIIEVAIEGDVANVWDCSQGLGEGYDADGNLFFPVICGPFPDPRVYVFDRFDGSQNRLELIGDNIEHTIQRLEYEPLE